MYSQELRYLNENFSAGTSPNLEAISSGRKGPVGKLLDRLKRKFAAVIWSLLESHLVAEREYNANVVRFLNDTSKYVDARDASIFWELIRKIDYDVSKALERVERSHDEVLASLRSSESRTAELVSRDIGALQASSAAHAEKLRVLDSVTRGLESILARQGKNDSSRSAEGADTPARSDYSYLLLENRYRGGEEEIAKRLSIYPAVFAGQAKPILEIGAGRGELQMLFKAGGLNSYGVDMDAAMVEVMHEKGLDARLEDGLQHLSSRDDRSLGGVIAIQVVEHLSWAQLQQLINLCRDKVAVGGRIVFETINPRSLLALSSNYFRDPTHVWPLHPDTLSYAMSLAGLDIREVRMLSPVPRESQLGELPIEEFVGPKCALLIESANRAIRQINELVYGFQDYCVIAEVR